MYYWAPNIPNLIQPMIFWNQLQRFKEHNICCRLDIKSRNGQLLLDQFPVFLVKVPNRVQSINKSWETTPGVRVVGTGSKKHVTKKKLKIKKLIIIFIIIKALVYVERAGGSIIS